MAPSRSRNGISVPGSSSVSFHLFWVTESLLLGLCLGLQCYTGTLLGKDCHSHDLHPATCISSPHNHNSSLPVVHCHIVQYHDTPKNSSTLRFAPTVPTNFSCDLDDICTKHKINGTKKITLGGHAMEVTCCKTDLCNVPGLLQHFSRSCEQFGQIPFKEKNITCFNGFTNDVGNVTKGEATICKFGRCQTVKTRGVGGKARLEYRCPLRRPAEGHHLQGDCININSNITICSCYEDKCNWPSNMPKNTMAPPVIQPQSQQPVNWRFAGGLIAAVVFSVLLLIVTVIVIRKCKQRQQERQLTYSYSRLTADLAEDGEDREDDMDINMLLA